MFKFFETFNKLAGSGDRKESERLSDEEVKNYVGERIDLDDLRERLKHDIFKNEGLLEAASALVVKLKDKIPGYDTVLSDDASGRLISLLLRKIINDKKGEGNAANIYFVAAGKNVYNQKAKSAIKEFMEGKSFGKTLLVTEYMQTGMSIRPLIRNLESTGTEFDLASLFIEDSPERYPSDIRKYLYYGSIGLRGAALWNKPELTGVMKEDGSDSPYPSTFRYADREAVGNVREDIETMAREFSSKLL